MKRTALLITAILLIISSFRLEAQDFEVAPVRVNFNVTPGESQSRTVTIKNHGNRKETFSIRLNDYLVQRQGDMELLPAGSTRNSISGWINLNPSFVELQPNESANIQVNLQAPTDDFSAKWGIMSFFTTAEQTAFTADRDLQTGVSVSGRIDIYLFYNPAAGDPGRVEIGNLQEIPGNNDERLFSVNLDNPGEKIMNTKVYLIASNLQTGEEHKFRTIEVVSYPQTARIVQLALPETLPPGRYALAAILDYPGSASLKGTQIIINVEE
ncbi:MAG: DUF916 domain-containing protein [Bacteroidales bacterium]|nr:DUF916 domain-containing protein [Bacteroidales bacterium]